mmetsp:Transcript_133807/g.245350  ORF Transcript_133807/g.245350 Transcript_133807/m.245350 type:complete len:355 (+) Transcript_133807:2-1066(+)
MLGIAIVACLLYVIGFGVLIVWVLTSAIMSFKDPVFQMRWKFLLIKYRPTVWWWSLAFLAKQFLLNLSAVIFSDPMAQYFSILTVTIAYVALVTFYMPYRHLIVNAVELFTGISIIYAACVLIAISYEKGEGSEENTLAMFSSILSFAPLACAAAAMLYLRSQFWATGESKRTKLVAEIQDIVAACNLIHGMSSKEQLDLLSYLSEWDRWYLAQVWHFTTAELLAKRSGDARRPVHRVSTQTFTKLEPELVKESNTESQLDQEPEKVNKQEQDAQESAKLLSEDKIVKPEVSQFTDSLDHSTADMIALSEASPSPTGWSVARTQQLHARPASSPRDDISRPPPNKKPRTPPRTR